MRRSRALWGIVAAAFLLPVLPRVLSHGLFMDGLLYSVVSRNLALGLGSFWRPMLTPTLTPEFFSDHPPLVFGIESFFYRAFGDHAVVGELYSLCTGVLTAIAIVWLWRRVNRDRGAESADWFPILLWAAIPLVTWSFSNNMLENTMGLFVLAASVFLLEASEGSRPIRFGAVAAVFLWGGMLCKGPLALFPLALPGLLWLTGSGTSLRRAASVTVTALAATAILVAAMMQFDPARENIVAYLHAQLLPSLRGERGELPDRFQIVRKLIAETLPAIGITGVFVLVRRYRVGGTGIDRAQARLAMAFILLGFAGSLPIAFSPRQSGFYLVPSFPMFAIGLALLAHSSALSLQQAVQRRPRVRRGLGVVAVALLVATTVRSASVAGRVGRDAALISDVHAIGAIVPRGATIALCPPLWKEWSLHGYLALYYGISLDRSTEARAFYLSRAGKCVVPEACGDRAAGMNLFELYGCAAP